MKTKKIIVVVAFGALCCLPAHSRQIEPIDFTQVKIQDAFWGPRLETNQRVTLPYNFKKCEETGRIANFAKAGGLAEGRFEGIYYSDQIEPTHSDDHEIPRFTWWDHRSGQEWVQYDFPEAQRVSRVRIYWFDDTGRGQCRIPAGWQLYYWDDKDKVGWTPVATNAAYGRGKDQYNQVDFTSIETSALRLMVQLQANSSGGILEWTVQ